MSSRGRNFRRRSDDDANGEERTSAPAVPSPTPKLTHSKPKPSKLLSFADDDGEADDGPPAPSRSSSRAPIHKHTSSRDRASPAPAVPSNYQPQSGEYTRERLLELQKNARPLGRPSLPDPEPPSKPAEPVIVLKGLVKPVPASEDRKPREIEIEESESRGEANGDTASEESRRLAKLGIDGRKPSESIPDQATIAAIRAKRERLRQTRSAAPDYISLDGGGVTSTRAAADSSDDEESDFRGRISLLESTGAGDAKDRKGIFESVEEKVIMSRTTFDEKDEEDDEERIWEEEQFRKALGKRLDASSSVALAAPPPVPLAPPPQPSGANAFLVAGRVSQSAEVLSFSQQAEVASRAAHEILDRLKEAHDRTVASLAKTDDSLSESLLCITDLEKALEDAGDKFVYVQKLRSYISILCDFLLDKTPYIEELEEQLQKLREDRAMALKERRALDIADEMAEVDAPVNAFMSVMTMSRGSGSKYLSAATITAQAAISAARESKNPPVQLDEFGRDLNLQKRADAARRADARKRRRTRSEEKRRVSVRGDNVCRLVEGECSTDESDSESKAYQSSQDEVLQVAGQVLSDATDEYSDLSIVKERLEDWKNHYPSSYRDAYMSLSAPDIFSPFVRLELLRWDPLNKDTDFNDMKWHTLLFDYGLPENGDDFDPGDPDANLIPEIVEKIALPILHHEIAHCWDIYSRRRTQNAVAAVKLVLNYITSSSEALRDLLGVVRSRLKEVVTDIIVPCWSTTILEHVLKDIPDAAYVAAHRFGIAVRLLGNICLWKDVLARPILEEIAFDLLNGKILPHLRSVMPHVQDAITRTERVISSVAGVWPGPKGEHSQKLQPLVNFVLELGRILEKRHTSGVSVDTHDHARSLKKMMVDLGEYDKARAILRTFQIKEAL